MSAMSELAATQALIDQLDDGPKAPAITIPARIIFHDGYIWRRSDRQWAVLSCDLHKLLDLYRQDAKALDWFAPTAAVLVAELEQAMCEAGIIKANRRAA